MARRRMFNLDVVDTDIFLDLPSSSQALYFHLGMRADDDGFVSSPKRITATVSCSADDMKLLIAKGFIIPFASGVCVLTDWNINNYIQKDRYKPTLYLEEKSRLQASETGAYKLTDTPWIQNVSSLDTQVRLGKDSIEQDSINISADKPQKRTRFVKPSVEEIEAYCRERGSSVDAQRFFDFYESKGWRIGKNPMKDWKAAVRNWERSDKDRGGKKATDISDSARYQTGKEFSL